MLEYRTKFNSIIVHCEICVIMQNESINIDKRKGIIMNEKRSFKKRLAGLLAMSLVLAMMMGMTVNAAPYYVYCEGATQGEEYGTYRFTLCTDPSCTNPANISTLSEGDTVTQTSSSGTLHIKLNNADDGDLGDNDVYTVHGGTYDIELTRNDTMEGTLALNPSTPNPPAPVVTQQQASCSHSSVESAVIKEPTETEDGIIGYYCIGCGELLSSELAASSSYAYFLKNIIDKINKAEPGSTVEISSKIWNSLSQDVMLAMAARRDINIVMTFCYQHEDYQYNIPAGTAIDTADTFYGPMYLGQLYGMTKLEK